MDIPLKTGEPIYATFDGKVRYSRYNSGGFGNLVIIRHPNGLETWYAHLTKRNVGSEEYVRAGQVIGYGGRRAAAGGRTCISRYAIATRRLIRNVCWISKLDNLNTRLLH